MEELQNAKQFYTDDDEEPIGSPLPTPELEAELARMLFGGEHDRHINASNRLVCNVCLFLLYLIIVFS